MDVDLQGDPSPSRSSVNNCTGSEGEPPEFDLSKPLSRHERRRLTNRLREQKPVVRRTFIHGTEEQGGAIERTIDEVLLTTGIKISRGEALHLIKGGKRYFNDKGYRGSAIGELFIAAPSHKAKARKILRRVEVLAASNAKVIS
ncbi:hypothetical protein D3C75_962580 [compost metagenome]